VQLDLGSGIDNEADLGCEFLNGLKDYDNNNKVKCILMKGAASPVVGDFTIVRVLNYGAIIAGTSGKLITFNIPLVHSVTLGLVPTLEVRAYRSDKKVKRLVRDKSISLTTTANILGTVLSAITPTSTSNYIQTKTNFTFTFTLTASITVSGNNSIFIEYPQGNNLFFLF
jgi:hypothetical protein